MHLKTKRNITVALVGNPNSGKTTIFNTLTGDRQHVGNYPGVTVEKKEGELISGDVHIRIVDLPGTYSLTAVSLDEQIARNFIIEEKPDVVVDIIDYSNLERNLYLTTQLIELGVPLLLVFNMSDVAENRGVSYNLPKLAERLGAPIIPTVGFKGQGKKEIIEAVISIADGEIKLPQATIRYGKEIEKELRGLEKLICQKNVVPKNYDSHWFALKLLENDREIQKKISSDEVITEVGKITEHLKNVHGENPEIDIAERRYRFISKVCRKTNLSTGDTHRLTISDKVDRVLTNRLFGLPIFLALMFLVFHFTFTLGGYPMEWIETFFGWLGGLVTNWWQPGSESMLKSLLVDGIIGGVGGVIIFLPNIMFLFLGISLLEDSGYMPRAAFIMDNIMQKFGLQGRSFMPMLIGFGCTVPAIMATRSLEDKHDRLITMLVLPLMSCGARFPIYALIIPAFFPHKIQGVMLLGIYLIGIVLAIISAKLLRMTVLKGPPTPLLMELPRYRIPTPNSVLTNMWLKSYLYLKKAGTIILGVSILLWAMTSYPKKAEITATDPDAIQSEVLAYSFAGRVGHAIEPVIKPMGFDWRIGTAMIGAFAAKEVFVSQMAIIYSVGEADEASETLRDKLQRNYTPLIGFSMLLFMLISAPCMATIAMTKQESGSWKWALFQLGGLTLMAYVFSVLVFQIGSLLGIGV
ncbi:MAG: ferrous iron transport protein B [Candidatus Hatepunaea meridiana]|nr:ferrous iron transport protein B [Candidatus Hatepunaea meridiana]